ncbi:precorrin-6Y C5,15-methyltransferase (decarboxylating) subunit CbiT [Bianquea renquensis]|uniref:Precorrin-6Y C5,15-methyltransferase (Decarboxylating) subunit CbiT n=1 Tax=Bianquea renquensis TaxID=2763661 RepID=A0A926DRT5_9FIRM|nr:precorrin-6Y C5,15-methyltransferase (decarboxylating) subunit CbiT [Bianquea renquensis]MBC8542129.1 precorrin-6Y C5,15-methyltransferase (decarboxylating) subunit CbiT [Bianquea renquensis]
MKLWMIGAGPGEPSLISAYALEVMRGAQVVLATERLYEAFQPILENVRLVSLTEMETFLADNPEDVSRVAVLASGDVGFYSISRRLTEKLSGRWEIERVSGVSSLQYLSAKLNIDYDDIKTVSVHGRDRSVIPFVSYNGKVFVLTGGQYRVQDVAEQLYQANMGHVILHVGENLSSGQERILSAAPAVIREMEFGNLAVLLIENPHAADCRHQLRDEDFLRGKVPMTKEEIRLLSVAKLDIHPQDVIWDIGAGTGSVSIALAYAASEGMVYAIERNEEAVALLAENRKRLGAYNVQIRQATAPEGLEKLPAPDKVFIGGSSGNMDAILEAVLRKNPTAQVVINAITLETLQAAVSSMEQRQMEPEILCASMAKADVVGGYHMMRGLNPIYILSGRRRA